MVNILFIVCLSLPLSFQWVLYFGGPVERRMVVVLLQLVVISVWLLTKGTRIRLGNRILPLITLAWLGWSVICLFQVGVNIYSVLRQVECFVAVFFVCVLIDAILRKERMCIFIYCLSLLGFFVAVLGVVVFWLDLAKPEYHRWQHAFPFFGNIRFFGHYALMASMLSICALAPIANWTRGEGGGGKNIITLALFIIALTALFWCGGRGPILALFAGAISYGFLAIDKGKRFRFSIVFLACVVAGMMLSLIFDTHDPSQGLFKALKRTLYVDGVNAATSSRISIWLEVISEIKNSINSIVFGFGPDGYRFNFFPEKRYPIHHPHNVFVQAMSEWGIVGCALFATLIVLILVKGFRLVNRDYGGAIFSRIDIARASYSNFVAFCVLSLFSGVYFHALHMTIICTSIAQVLSCKKIKSVKID